MHKVIIKSNIKHGARRHTLSDLGCVWGRVQALASRTHTAHHHRPRERERERARGHLRRARQGLDEAHEALGEAEELHHKLGQDALGEGPVHGVGEVEDVAPELQHEVALPGAQRRVRRRRGPGVLAAAIARARARGEALAHLPQAVEREVDVDDDVGRPEAAREGADLGHALVVALVVRREPEELRRDVAGPVDVLQRVVGHHGERLEPHELRHVRSVVLGVRPAVVAERLDGLLRPVEAVDHAREAHVAVNPAQRPGDAAVPRRAAAVPRLVVPQRAGREAGGVAQDLDDLVAGAPAAA
mmetsp:Transcript_27620/g.87554  ORF Transcript_27620/g.87554 Transcript_27620/m.87554 type:complete len:301 (+) Transcript_27620:335-1237(+)